MSQHRGQRHQSKRPYSILKQEPSSTGVGMQNGCNRLSNVTTEELRQPAVADFVRVGAGETSDNHQMINNPEIDRLLWDSYPAAIHNADQAIYVLRPDLTLAYVNLGWTRFAAQNGGDPMISSNWPIGSSVLTAIAAVLRPFFAKNYAKCLQEKRPWEHRYECSSPELYRSFVMMTYPLGAGEGLLTVNSLVQEMPHTRCSHEPMEALYRDQHNFILQCCHCRRVKRRGAEPRWDWVPDWVRACPANTSHGLCEPCFGFHYRNSDQSNGFSDTFRTGE